MKAYKWSVDKAPRILNPITRGRMSDLCSGRLIPVKNLSYTSNKKLSVPTNHFGFDGKKRTLLFPENRTSVLYPVALPICKFAFLADKCLSTTTTGWL